MWRVRLTSRAKKELAALDKRQRIMLEGWMLENLEGCENPRAVHGGKHMVDTECG